MKIYLRESKKIYEDKQYKENILNFLYNNPLGRILLKILIRPSISKLNGFYNSSKLSKHKIPIWIDKYNIDMRKYEDREYKSFNDFFVRKRKVSRDKIPPEGFISPAESRVIVYNITENMEIKIKGIKYNLKELLKEDKVISDYSNGYCFVFHLTVDSYHRYCFIDNGRVLSEKEIKGKLHTVSSISKDYKIYKENHRKYSVLETENFGEVIMIEVGALLVGKIKNHNIKSFRKGEEKGYFKLGGSSIILLVKDKTLIIDKDILKYSKLGIPVKVDYQERIGKKYV